MSTKQNQKCFKSQKITEIETEKFKNSLDSQQTVKDIAVMADMHPKNHQFG